MNKKEAAVNLQALYNSLQKFVEEHRNAEDSTGSIIFAGYAEAVRQGIEALSDDHYPDTEKMVPLTLEQLREMDGQPVWMVLVDDTNSCEWMIVCAKGKCCEGKTYIVDFSNIGNLWLAYAYQPAYIDREVWNYCEACKPNCYNCLYQNAWDTNGKPDKCKKCVNFSNHVADEKFCEKCGRPLTPEAWAELEKRLRGCVE